MLVKDTYIILCKVNLTSPVITIACPNGNIILREQFYCETCGGLAPETQYKIEINETEVKELESINKTIKRITIEYIIVKTATKQLKKSKIKNDTRLVTFEIQKSYMIVCKQNSEDKTLWIRCGGNNILLQLEHKCNICFCTAEKRARYLVVAE